jgi:hypothetical protein
LALSKEQTTGLAILLGALALSTATNNKLDRKTLESLPEAVGVAILTSVRVKANKFEEKKRLSR